MGATSEVFSGPFGEELWRRLERAVSEARGLLGVAVPPSEESADLDVVTRSDRRAALAAVRG